MEKSTNEASLNAKQEVKDLPKESRPQEKGSIQIDTSVKIFDPNSGEIFLEGRG